VIALSIAIIVAGANERTRGEESSESNVMHISLRVSGAADKTERR
jgi:hypothetical protein